MSAEDILLGTLQIYGLFATAGTLVWLARRCKTWYRRRQATRWAQEYMRTGGML